MSFKSLLRRASGFVTAFALLASMMVVAGAKAGTTTTTGTTTGIMISDSESGYSGSGSTCKLCGSSFSHALLTKSDTSTHVAYPQYYSKSTRNYLASTSSRVYASNTNLYCVSVKVNGIYYPLCTSCLENQLKLTRDSDDYATLYSGSSKGSLICRTCSKTFIVDEYQSSVSTIQTYQSYYHVPTIKNCGSTDRKAYSGTTLGVVADTSIGGSICQSCLEQKIAQTYTKSGKCAICSNAFSISQTTLSTQDYTEYFSVDSIADLKSSAAASNSAGVTLSIVYTGTALRYAAINVNNKASPICQSCLEAKVADYKSNHREGTSVDSATGSASVPVTVTREAATFSVTVPTTLPISVDADGNVTTATDAAIINNSGAPVAVTKVELTSQNDWTLAAYSRDILNLPVDTKQFGLQMNIGDKTAATSSSGTSDVLSDSLNARIAKGQNCAVTYDALFPAQTAAVSNTQIANVVFTVGWA